MGAGTEHRYRHDRATGLLGQMDHPALHLLGRPFGPVRSDADQLALLQQAPQQAIGLEAPAGLGARHYVKSPQPHRHGHNACDICV